MSRRDDPAPEKWTNVRMAAHILGKGWQAGSVLGTVAGTGYLLSGLMFSGGTLDVHRLLKVAGPAGIAFTGLTGLMGIAKLYNEPQDRIEDRVYRLYYNEGQNHVDSLCTEGFAFGAAAPFIYQLTQKGGNVQAVSPTTVLGAAAVGTAAGIAIAVATFPKRGTSDGKTMRKQVSDSIDKMG